MIRLRSSPSLIVCSPHPSKLELIFWLLGMSHRCVRQFSEERLNKQAGPSTKSPPLRDMWQQNPLNPCSPSHTPTGATQTLPHTLSVEPREGKDGGWGGNSDSYSLNVTTLQRGPHDTATKSELMDSFLSPANMTGGVCVRVRGCGRGMGSGEGACLPH